MYRLNLVAAGVVWMSALAWGGDGERPTCGVVTGMAEPGWAADAALTGKGGAANRMADAGDCSSVGPQKVAVILVTFPGVRPPRWSGWELRYMMFGEQPDSVASWYARASYGKVSMSGEVFGPYTLDRSYSCSEMAGMQTAAIRAADRDLNFAEFQRFVVIFPAIAGCPFGATATLGCGDVQSDDGKTRGSWVYSNDYSDATTMKHLLIHELGHNLGVGHSRMLRFPGTAVEADSFRAVPIEYGDTTAVMGSAMQGDFAAAHKVRMQWLSAGADVANVEEDGDFVLAPLEGSEGVRALRVRRRIGSDEWLWLEYRRDAGSSGTLVRLETPDANLATNLLDMTPTSLDRQAQGFSEASERWPELVAQSVWSDPHSGLTITLGWPAAEGLPVSVRYDQLCESTVEQEVTVSPEAQSIRLGIGDGCTGAVTNRSWLSASRREATAEQPGEVTVHVAALEDGRRRSGYVTVGRRAIRVTQRTERREAAVRSMWPPTGEVPRDESFPLLLLLRHDGGTDEMEALQLQIAAEGTAGSTCYFRFAQARPGVVQVSEDGVEFRDSGVAGTGDSGGCTLRGTLGRYTATDLGFRGTLSRLPDGAALRFSIRTEAPGGETGGWLKVADWRVGVSGCLTVPLAIFNSYLAVGTTNDAVPLRSTPSGCGWSASSDAAWLSLRVTTSELGAAPRFDVFRNEEPVAREGTILLNDTPIVIVQRSEVDPFFVTVRPSDVLVAAREGKGIVSFYNALADLVPATTETPWLWVDKVSRSADQRVVEFGFSANPESTARVGTLWIAGKRVDVMQAGR